VLNAADPGASSDNADAVGAGLSVEELTPRDPMACEELVQLVRNVFKEPLNKSVSTRPRDDL
jgi:hypothetical protein